MMVATNIQMATTKIQNGCHKYSKELWQMSKWLPQIFTSKLTISWFILGNTYTFKNNNFGRPKTKCYVKFIKAEQTIC